MSAVMIETSINADEQNESIVGDLLTVENAVSKLDALGLVVLAVGIGEALAGPSPWIRIQNSKHCHKLNGRCYRTKSGPGGVSVRHFAAQYEKCGVHWTVRGN